MRDTLIAVSSCQYPADFFRYREAYKSLGAMAKLFEQPKNREHYRVMMLAGDTIYADATAGVMDPTDPHERFTQQYHKLRNNWAWRKIDAHERLFSLDDHELIDDWAPLDAEHPNAELRAARAKARIDGKRSFLSEMQIDDLSDGNTYYHKLVNGMPIFVMDSRTDRMYRNASNIKRVSMIDDAQMVKLRDWMSALAEKEKDTPDVYVTPKIIMSGSMLLPRLRTSAERWDKDSSYASCLHSDGWDGYPKTMHDVLAHIANIGLRKVIFVSGDAHIPCVCDIKIHSDDDPNVNILSVHGSGLNAPMPFLWAMVFVLSKTALMTISINARSVLLVSETGMSLCSSHRCSTHTC